MKFRCFLAILFALPITSFGAPKQAGQQMGTAWLMCATPAKDVFASLISGNLIDPRPVEVGNYGASFKPHLLKPITIQNMHVSAVAGYVADQVLFSYKGDVQPQEWYGFAVSESIANVQALLTSMGSPAKIGIGGKGMTFIACHGA